MNILIIDDERTFTKLEKELSLLSLDYVPVFFYARTLTQAKDYFYGSWPIIDVVYLDHDLGNGEDVRTLTREIEQDAHDGIIYEIDKFVIHSMNPLGRKEMYEALHKFYNVEFAKVEDLI